MMYQGFGTTVGATYNLTFDCGTYMGMTAPVYDETWLMDVLIVDDYLNPVNISLQEAVNTWNPNQSHYYEPELQYSFEFTAASNFSYLIFSGEQYNHGWFLLDDVSVELVSAQVPEPSTFALVAFLIF